MIPQIVIVKKCSQSLAIMLTSSVERPELVDPESQQPERLLCCARPFDLHPPDGDLVRGCFWNCSPQDTNRSAYDQSAVISKSSVMGQSGKIVPQGPFNRQSRD